MKHDHVRHHCRGTRYWSGEPTRTGYRHNVPPSAIEGIDWIRGWHYAESEDAQAMLAAWKLRGSIASDGTAHR